MRHDSWTPAAPTAKRDKPARGPVAFMGTEFNNFLFATAAEDGNGVAVTVLSALARLDLDPWDEAAKLRDLPKDSAVQRLAGVIAPLSAATPAEARKTAARLLGLLPGATATLIPAKISSARLPDIAHLRSILAFLLVFMAVMLSLQFLMHYAVPPAHSIAPLAHVTQPMGITR